MGSKQTICTMYMKCTIIWETHLQTICEQSEEHKEIVALKVLHISHYSLAKTWNAWRGAEISRIHKHSPCSYVFTTLTKPFFGSQRRDRNLRWKLEHTLHKTKYLSQLPESVIFTKFKEHSVEKHHNSRAATKASV